MEKCLDYRILWFAMKKKYPCRCGGGNINATAGYYAISDREGEKRRHFAIFS